MIRLVRYARLVYEPWRVLAVSGVNKKANVPGAVVGRRLFGDHDFEGWIDAKARHAALFVLIDKDMGSP